MNEDDTLRLSKRYNIINKIQYYIDESVYYRTHSDEFLNKKFDLWNYPESSGNVDIYED